MTLNKMPLANKRVIVIGSILTERVFLRLGNSYKLCSVEGVLIGKMHLFKRGYPLDYLKLVFEQI